MTDDLARQLFKDTVINARAYHVPDSKGFIKLDAMENPYAWSADYIQQWTDFLKQAELNRYPDASASDMHSALATLFDIPVDTGMLFGNGSDELIQIVLMALKRGSKVLAPEPTFVMYRHISEMLELEFLGVPLQEDFTLDMPAMLDTIQQQKPAVIFLAWPNNPTGNAFEAGEIEQIIKATDGLVIIDEAYHVFAGKTMLSAVKTYNNVMVMRTLSKQGLAGLRVGTLIGPLALIDELEKIRLPYNIGSLNQLSVQFICQHIGIFEDQAEQIKRDRESLYQALLAMDQLQVWPTQANFILVRLLHQRADDVHQVLKDKRILIKNLSAAHPLLDNCLRITVGTGEENESLLQALQEILQ